MNVIRRLALLLLFYASADSLFAAAPPASPPPSPEQLQRLIEALGDANYFVRQKAESDLGKIGFEALDALSAAVEHDDMEVAARANRLLYAIRSDWTLPGEPPQVSRLLSDYDALEDAGREARISQLVELPENQGVAAICRVIRYERSLPLAKTAALRLLESKENGIAKPDFDAILEKGLHGCRREPARWVLGWLQARRNPKLLAEFWSRLAAGEEGLLFRQPRDTSAAIVESLLRCQITALRATNHGADAARSVEMLITLRRGEPDELSRLLNWLILQADWPATRLVENRCKATIAQSADLLYLLAEAQTQRGDVEAGKQSADQALEMNSNSDETSLATHLQAGENLQERGRFEWAIREWDRVIQNAPPKSAVGTETAHLLSELYHDLEDDRKAAETLSRVEKAFTAAGNESPFPNQEESDLATLGSLRARRCYFDACYWKSRGDLVRQRASLDKALATKSYDIEVLIDCFHLPNSTSDYRARIRKLIEKRLCELREQVADIGINHAAAAQPCKEFAWLAANTEGNLDEALRLSERSLEVAGDRGSYCDTLARVYFAKGDFANALRHQMQAAELMPHNRAVHKQLVVFQAKAKEMGIHIEKIEKGLKAAAPIARTPAEPSPFD